MSNSLDPNIDIPDEIKYIIPVQATPQPIIKKNESMPEKKIKIKIPSKEEEYKEELKNLSEEENKKPQSIVMNQHTNEELQDIIFKYGESLELGILTIYYICKIFPKKSKIDKIFFSGSELNYILKKHSQFFYKINDRLENNNLIKYYGTVTRKEKSNKKVYLITEKGVKFSKKIIEVRRQDFPTLFDKFINTLEKKYIEYNRNLIDSEKRIIIRSYEDINNELKKIAGDNNIELVTSYQSDRLEIEFRCRKCKKQFKDTYQLIRSRKSPKLFCPYCFPELKTNMIFQKS